MIGRARAFQPISQVKIGLRSVLAAVSISCLHCIWHYDLPERKKKKRKIKKQNTET